MRFLLDALWPQRCALCDRMLEGASPLHAHCLRELPRTHEDVPVACPLPARPPLWAHFADGPGFFRLLHQIKYGGRPRLLHALAEAMARRGLREGWLHAGVVLVPLPDDARRRRERGYSVTGRLAGELARWSAARVDASLLGRREGGRAQASLGGAGERLRNQRERWVSGALDRVALDLPLLLIEDQITTGATASAALLRLGARGHRVACIALARSAAAPRRLVP